MDKQNTTIGVLLLLAAFAVIYFAPRSGPPTNTRPGTEQLPSNVPGGPVTPAALPAPGQSMPPPQSAVNAAFAAAHPDSSDAVVTILRNDFIEARFTDSGGALRDVALITRNEKGRLTYPDELGSDQPFVFNALSSDPILAFVDFPGLDRNSRFERVSYSDSEVVYRATLESGLEVTRRYRISPSREPNTDPYQIRYETTFHNTAQQPVQPMRVWLAIGTAAPTNANDPGIQLTTGYSDGDDEEFIARAKLESSSGFFGIGAHGATPYITSAGSFVWTAVKNQFFTSILTGEQPAAELVSRRVKLLDTLPDEMQSAYGIAGTAKFDVQSIAAGGEATLAGDVYVGPKEYRRLANTNVFQADQDKVMDFGFFKYFSQILITLMTWIHGWANNWGIAIILTTLALKTIFIPFTLAASKSAKRMAKIQPELQAIREKFKDNPQKQQQATMELFKTRKINPVGGCFPVLITIPFFMGFFQMLQSAAELRFAPFLWADSLAHVDTVGHILGIDWLPLRIMPLLMGATMVIQMQLTPSPSVDNMQMKMMKFMPYVFTFFCYNFSCALSLYSFVNGVFTIGQQLVINRMKEPDPAVTQPTAPGRKPIKNVTPASPKKRLK